MTALSYRLVLALLFGLAMQSFAGPAHAEFVKRQELGKEGVWTVAINYDKKGLAACTVTGAPSKQSGKYTRRGETYIQITHWYREQKFNEIRMLAGYRIAEESTVTLSVDDLTGFSLLPLGDSAWTSDDLDPIVVKTMMNGRRLVVSGLSAKRTKTTDVYNLTGLRAAVLRAGRACLRR
ncbi:MAG: invasion associated locus B family protein [Alphaproteobacteria bacterium]|nr:invasion associated locus B family protein [Alphaproteobacteria bacterium]